jgi:hypothetical protein
MEDGSRTSANYPMPGCNQKLTYEESGPIRLGTSGGNIVIPIEQNFYRCEQHGLFRYLGDGKFSRVDEP